MRSCSLAGSKAGLEMNHAVDAHFATPAQVRRVEHSSAGGDEYLVLDGAADHMAVGADQAIVADAQGVARAAAQHRVVHDDALAADIDRAALGDQLGAEQDAAAGADADVAAKYGVGRDPGGGIDAWRLAGVGK